MHNHPDPWSSTRKSPLFIQFCLQTRAHLGWYGEAFEVLFHWVLNIIIILLYWLLFKVCVETQLHCVHVRWNHWIGFVLCLLCEIVLTASCYSISMFSMLCFVGGSFFSNSVFRMYILNPILTLSYQIVMISLKSKWVLKDNEGKVS